MVLTLGQNVILFGKGASICEALSTKEMGSLNVLGVCQDSLLDDADIPSYIKTVSFETLGDANAVVVVVNDEISKSNLDYFTDHNITYCLLKDMTIDDTVAETIDQMPSEPLEEEEEDDAPVENTTVAEVLTAEADEVAEDDAEPVADTEETEEAPAYEIVESEKKENVIAITTSFSDEQFEQIKSTLETYFDEVLKAIKTNKSKDTSIYNINKELQKFKDDYYTQICNPLISDLIALREDCKTSLDNLTKFNLNHDKQINNIRNTVYQIEELFDANGVTVKDGIYYFNGVAFYPTADDIRALGAKVESCEEETVEEVCDENAFTLTDNSPEAIAAFLTEAQQRIEKCLADNEALIQTIAQQVEENKKKQKVCDGLLLDPIFVKIVQLNDYFEKRVRVLEAAPTDEESAEIYASTFSFAADYIEALLLKLGVSIRSNIDDTFEPKYHRMLKMAKLTPEEADKDKKVAQFCTDCYMIGDKVIAPAKVIIYRL